MRLFHLTVQSSCTLLMISFSDFNSPFVPPGSKPKSGQFVPNEEGVAMVMAMGFNRDQAVKALKNTVRIHFHI